MEPDAPPAVPDRSRAGRMLRNPRTWLAVYAITLAVIAFWPTHVDRDAGPFLRFLEQTFPFLTYDRTEFIANILLFVPLGVILALVVRWRWVLPIALAVTAMIELLQALVLPGRTASLSDVVANLIGAGVGLGVVVLVRTRQR